MANDRAARERREDQQRADAAAAAQRDHDRAMAAQAHANAVQLQQMQAAENQKGRDFQKKQSAKERASQYATANMRKPTDMTADHIFTILAIEVVCLSPRQYSGLTITQRPQGHLPR